MPTPPPARDPDSSGSRRGFFRSALRSVLDAAEDVVDMAQDLGHEVKSRGAPLASFPSPGGLSFPSPGSLGRALLRPPGAIAEIEFVEHCQHSGICISACPISAIQRFSSPDPFVDGTPHIIPAENACVLCDDLSCMKACPSGALQFVEREAIAMGLATIDHSVCSRTFGDDCTICVERCPIGPSALEIVDNELVVHADGCTGCGVCEHYCPTAPRAIRIVANDE